jgi:hypothetical protein
MAETIGNKTCPVHGRELARWFDVVLEHWNPITAAERQLDALTEDAESLPVLAAFEHRYEIACEAMRWLEFNPCPDKEMRRRLNAQVDGPSDCGGTARFTFLAGGDAVVAQLVDLRQLVDQHIDAIALCQPVPKGFPVTVGGKEQHHEASP